MFDMLKRGANISHKDKFVWTAPAKVASRSVRDIFIEHCDLNPDWPSEEHPISFTHVNNWPEEAGDDYLHIASIRHPYYRWLSYYKYARTGEQNELTLDPLKHSPIECLEDMNPGWVETWGLWNIINTTNKRIDYVIGAESIKHDISQLPFMKGIDFEVPIIGATQLEYNVTFSESELRNLCYDKFKADYIQFGYEKYEVIDLWDRKYIPNGWALR